MDRRTRAVGNVAVAALIAASGCAAHAFCSNRSEQVSPLFCALGDQSFGEWHMHLGGASVHSSETQAPGRRWREQHAGIGVEWRTSGLPWEGLDLPGSWGTTHTFGTFTDSRGFWSYYGGTVLTNEVARLGSTRMNAGAGAFLFYRSRTWAGQMALQPAVLPVLTFTDKQTALGFNFIWRPPGFDGPGTVFIQITRPLGE